MQFSLRESGLAQEVNLSPGHNGPLRNGVEESLPLRGVGQLRELLRERQIVPADQTMLAEPFTAFRQFLFVLFGLQELAWIADRHGAGEAMRSLNLIEWPGNGLAERDVVKVAQDEEGFEDPAKRLERPVKRVLLGVGIEAAEQGRSLPGV